MYLDSPQVWSFADAIGVSYNNGVLILVYMKEMEEAGFDFSSLSAAYLSKRFGVKLKVNIRQLLEAREAFRQETARRENRERKRASRERKRRKNVTAEVTEASREMSQKSVTQEKESTSPLDGPFPPGTPNPPIIPPTREREGVTPPKPTDVGFAPGGGKAKKDGVALRRFVKPGVEEVRAYCVERGNRVDAQKFVDYYESNGWRVGRNPMKDWKAAVRTWERNSDGRGDAQKRSDDKVIWR